TRGARSRRRRHRDGGAALAQRQAARRDFPRPRLRAPRGAVRPRRSARRLRPVDRAHLAALRGSARGRRRAGGPGQPWAAARRPGWAAEQVTANSLGRRTADLARLVAPPLDADTEAERIQREEIERSCGLRPLPGARELVESVPADRFAIVTSGSRQLAIARLRAAGLSVPAVLVTAEEVADGKPDPAGYLRAAELLGVDPTHSLVLQDAPAGTEA